MNGARRAGWCAAAALPVLALWLLLGDERRERVVHVLTGRVEKKAPVGLVHEVAHVRGEPFAPEVIARRSQTRSADEAALRDAIAAASSETDVRDLQDLRSSLTRLLVKRPELGPAAVDALSRLNDRGVLFAVSRALRAVASDALVHSQLLALAAASSTDAVREAAIGTLGGRGDERALAVFTSVLGDGAAGPLARAAAAYELSKELALAPDPSTAVARARVLGGDPDTNVRAEAWGVLGAAGLDDADRAIARAALTDQLPVAMGAARALLASGEPPASVAHALADKAANEPVLAAALEQLEHAPSPREAAGGSGWRAGNR
jgi:hypothetical protein